MVNFDKPGIITGVYAYNFGKVNWEVKAVVSQHSCSEDSTACLVIGMLKLYD